jgi:hypothetical protein
MMALNFLINLLLLYLFQLSTMKFPLWTERCTHSLGDNIRHEVVMEEQADCQFCGAVNNSSNALLLPRHAAKTTEARESRIQRGLATAAFDPRPRGSRAPTITPATSSTPAVKTSQQYREPSARRSVAPSIGPARNSPALEAKKTSLARTRMSRNPTPLQHAGMGAYTQSSHIPTPAARKEGVTIAQDSMLRLWIYGKIV